MTKPSIKTLELSPVIQATGEPLQNGEVISPDVPLRIGIVGLGHMGGAFARNLLVDGHHVIAFDRDPERAASLRERGAEAAASLAALSDCDFVVSSVPDDDALRAVALGAGGLVEVMREGAIHVSMSTVSSELSRSLAAAHAARHQAYVAAPVLGNPDLAHDRKLFVLAAGDPEAVRRAKPLLASLGQRVFVIGDEAAAANLMKLAGNRAWAKFWRCCGRAASTHRSLSTCSPTRCSMRGCTRPTAERSSTNAMRPPGCAFRLR